MILMDIKLDNIYGFIDFQMNFSYQRKLKKTTIENEFVPTRPNFKYKKAIVLKGANATGKTSLGKSLLAISNYILHGSPDTIASIVSDAQKPASCTMEYVKLSTMQLVRFKTDYNPPSESGVPYFLESSYSLCDIRQDDNYEKCKEVLDAKQMTKITPADFNVLKDYGSLGFRYRLTEIGRSNILEKHPEIDEEIFLDSLDKILRTLDPSFDKVYKSKEIEDCYVIQRGSSQILIRNGVLQGQKDLLSTGTEEGINIAIIVAAIRQHVNGFYYIDEQLSHIQSDLEKHLFSTMVQKLGPGEQLIFTTHNNDLLDVNLPKHSFAFLRKEKINDKYVIRVSFSSEKLKRDTDCVRCAEENDVFSSLPNESLLDQLDEEEF